MAGPASLTVNNQPVQIGSRSVGTIPEAFNGTIDEVRITNRALTPSEIASESSAELAEGRYYWTVTASDGENTGTTVVSFFDVVVDVLPPEPPTDFAVLPGHQKCKLSWENPTAPDFAGVMIRRNPWGIGAYPEYDDTPVGYPASWADGDEAYVGTAQSFRYFSGTGAMPRNVYYYTIFSFDAAGNYSGASPVVQGESYELLAGRSRRQRIDRHSRSCRVRHGVRESPRGRGMESVLRLRTDRYRAGSRCPGSG